MKLQSAALHAGPQLAQDSTWYPGSLIYSALLFLHFFWGIHKVSFFTYIRMSEYVKVRDRKEIVPFCLWMYVHIDFILKLRCTGSLYTTGPTWD